MTNDEPVTYTYRQPPPPAANLPGYLVRSTDGASIPCDLKNTDYQAFLEWLAAGNAAPQGWTGPTN